VNVVLKLDRSATKDFLEGGIPITEESARGPENKTEPEDLREPYHRSEPNTVREPNVQSEPKSEREPLNLLSIDEAAQRLGFSHWTIRLWIKQRKMTSIKISNRVLVPSSECDRLIAKGMQPAMEAQQIDDDWEYE
jgi:excisionase family DNA binding protein